MNDTPIGIECNIEQDVLWYHLLVPASFSLGISLLLFFSSCLSSTFRKIKKEIIFLLMAWRNLWPFTYCDYVWYETWFVVCLKHEVILTSRLYLRQHKRRICALDELMIFVITLRIQSYHNFICLKYDTSIWLTNSSFFSDTRKSLV